MLENLENYQSHGGSFPRKACLLERRKEGVGTKFSSFGTVLAFGSKGEGVMTFWKKPILSKTKQTKRKKNKEKKALGILVIVNKKV